LSKALKLQQENKDRKNDLVISNLEERVKELENLLEEKDSKINTAEANLTEAQHRIKDQATRISDQNKHLKEAHSNLKEARIRYEHEVKGLMDKVKAKAKKSSKLFEALKMLRDTCSGFATRWSLHLREIFSLVGAMSGEEKYSADDIPKALEFVEKINEFDEVMVGHEDFCALVAAQGATNIFAKARCKHLRDVNKPTFTISPADL
jgi:predicted  nucleic acid-binding Zn-ribbon protein